MQIMSSVIVLYSTCGEGTYWESIPVCSVGNQTFPQLVCQAVDASHAVYVWTPGGRREVPSFPVLHDSFAVWIQHFGGADGAVIEVETPPIQVDARKMWGAAYPVFETTMAELVADLSKSRHAQSLADVQSNIVDVLRWKMNHCTCVWCQEHRDGPVTIRYDLPVRPGD